MLNDYALNATDTLTVLMKSNGIETWKQAINHVKKLPYGRNKNREDITLVLTEQKGSCSSKHALLKEIADLNFIPNVHLILGMYAMNDSNTPKIGDELYKNNINYLPEAHCYLKIEEKNYDFTNTSSDFSTIKDDIITELEITPKQVSTYKVNFHQQFLKQWIIEEKLPLDFNTIWEIRENCIRRLSE